MQRARYEIITRFKRARAIHRARPTARWLAHGQIPRVPIIQRFLRSNLNRIDLFPEGASSKPTSSVDNSIKMPTKITITVLDVLHSRLYRLGPIILKTICGLKWIPSLIEAQTIFESRRNACIILPTLHHTVSHGLAIMSCWIVGINSLLLFVCYWIYKLDDCSCWKNFGLHLNPANWEWNWNGHKKSWSSQQRELWVKNKHTQGLLKWATTLLLLLLPYAGKQTNGSELESLFSLVIERERCWCWCCCPCCSRKRKVDCCLSKPTNQSSIMERLRYFPN